MKTRLNHNLKKKSGCSEINIVREFNSDWSEQNMSYSNEPCRKWKFSCFSLSHMFSNEEFNTIHGVSNE